MAAKDGFSAEERAAIKQRAAELKASGKKSAKDTEADVLEAIAKMEPGERAIAERLHALVMDLAPDITAKTWYGFPAYARGKDVIVFFQFASKFGSRYSTLGFNDGAALDKGDMWPTHFAITEWTEKVEKDVRALVKRALA